MYDDEPEFDPNLNIESHEIKVLPDNAQYEGQWNTVTGKRHGKGY
jgi:hypothetical protein